VTSGHRIDLKFCTSSSSRWQCIVSKFENNRLTGTGNAKSSISKMQILQRLKKWLPVIVSIWIFVHRLVYDDNALYQHFRSIGISAPEIQHNRFLNFPYKMTKMQILQRLKKWLPVIVSICNFTHRLVSDDNALYQNFRSISQPEPEIRQPRYSIFPYKKLPWK